MLRRNTISMIVLPKVDCFFVFPVGSTVCWINDFCRIMPKNTLLVNLRKVHNSISFIEFPYRFYDKQGTRK